MCGALPSLWKWDAAHLSKMIKKSFNWPRIIQILLQLSGYSLVIILFLLTKCGTVGTSASHSEVPSQMLAWTPAVPTDFHHFHVPPGNAGIVPQIGHDYFFPHPLEFISYYDPTRFNTIQSMLVCH